MIALYLIAILVIAALVRYLIHMLHMESYVKHLQIKGPVYPFFGNALVMLGKSPVELFKEIVETLKLYDTPVKAYMGPILVITIDKPEDFKTILMSQHCVEKPYLYQFYPSTVGIFTATSSAVWRPLRKMMNPSFSPKILQSFVPIFNEKVKILIENLDREVTKPHFDILPFMNACTLDMICATSMGYNVDVQRNKNREFLQSIEMFFDIVGQRFTKFWAHADFIFQWTDLYKQQQTHLNNLHRLTTQIYHIKKEEYIIRAKAKAEEHANSSDDVYKSPQILIDQLFDLLFAGKIDEQTAIEEIETILIAGNETSALTVSYTILALAMHPDMQERLFEELCIAYESQDQDTTNEHIQQLTYLDRVIKESLRIFPVGPFMVRCANADVAVSNCVIPKNSYITLSIYNLHRRPDIWGESADQFNPDHFLPENVEKRHPFSYVPFAGGPRNCIGYQYSMLTMKTMIAGLLRHFKFTTNLTLADLEMKFQITLKLCNKHVVGVEKRVWPKSH